MNLTLPLAGVVEQTTVSAAAPLVEVARSQPSSVVTKRDIDTLPLLDRNFLVLAQLLPGSGPINSTVDPAGDDEVRRRRRSARRLHDADRRRRHRRYRVGQPDDQRRRGRGPGIQGVPQPVRRPIRPCVERRRDGRDPLGHEPVQRHRFLFRARRGAERAVSVCGRESAVRRAAGGRIDRRSPGARPESLLRVVRARQRRQRPRHRAACPATDLPHARTASSRRRRTTRWPARGSTIGSARLTRCRRGTRRIVSSRCARTPGAFPIRARWTSSTGRTAWLSTRPGSRDRTS